MFGFTIPIVRTNIHCDMHDGGEGGQHPPPSPLRAFPWNPKMWIPKDWERGVVSISLTVAHFGSS